MRDKFFALCLLIHRFIARRYAIRIRFAQAQTSIAMSRGEKTTHYILTPEERQWLLSIGAEMAHDVKDILMIVHWKTYQRWVREERRGIEPGRVGRRKTIAREIAEVVERLARENLTWGKKRIVGELKKLGIRISVSSVMRILRKAKLQPPPDKTDRRAPVVPWSTFVSAHLDSIVASDFFTQTVWTWRGRMEAYCLFFIHLGSRKVYCSPVTLNPDEQWVMQQARNVAMRMEDEGIKPRFILHDHDTKYTARFDDFFRRIVKEHAAPKQGQIIKSIIAVPQMNGYAESFVSTIRREILVHFVCVSLSQVDCLIDSFIKHYHAHRPHQGRDIGNNVLDPDFAPAERGIVKSEAKLGGLLRHYYREAA